MSEQSLVPVRKVTAAGIGGAASIVLIWLIGVAGVEVPPEVASSLTTLLAFGAGYMVRS